MRLQGKVAIITGASSGFGAATAKLFAKKGAKVVVADIQETRGREVESEIIADGGDAVFVKLDVTSEADWRQAIDTTVAKYGKLNVLVNNAGISARSGEVNVSDEMDLSFGGPTLEQTSQAVWESVMAVNAKGAFIGSKMAIPEMRKAGGGSIINVGSMAGIVGIGSPCYNASKGAIRLFTKAIAIEYAKEGIRVNCVHPNTTHTNMNTKLYSDPQKRQWAASQIPMGRLGHPEDIAYGALFLASDESSFVTGIDLPIDGGYTAQ